MKRLSIITIFSFIFFISCDIDQQEPEYERVVTGAENLVENYLGELEGKRVGLVMNPTARIGERHMLDILLEKEINLTALYAPEHGFRGEAGAGDIIEDGVDQESGLPVFSLYGETRKPTEEMLDEVDILLFDMQDVGARFYTYHATMGLVMEAAADADKPVWVLDRPNPIGGEYVNGWMMEEEHKSFVGPYEIPAAHGMTLGELAKMMVGENWLDIESDSEPELKVIEMNGWDREMKWPDTGLEWVAPSPNLPTFEHAYIYLGTCLIEGTTLSEGRGTPDPFLTLGSPGTELTDEQIADLNRQVEHATITPAEFTPEEIPGVATSPKHEGELSYGISIELESTDYDPVRSGLLILKTLMDASNQAEVNDFMYRLTGTEKVDEILSGSADPMSVDFELDSFMQQREQYLIY